MITVARSVVTVLLAAGLTLAELPQQDRGTIQGIVKDRKSGRGIPETEISLAGPAKPTSAKTDAEGRFVFTELPEGRYTLRTLPNGYVGVSTTNVLGVVATPVVIDSQQPSQSITIEFVKSSAISGRIRAESGIPVAGIRITPMRLGYQNGVPSLRAVPLPVETNGQGEFRLTQLPPGPYYLRAEKGGSSNATSNSPARFTYFPGTTNSAAAAPVTVGESEELPGIDFSIPAMPSVKVSGEVVIGVPGGCKASAGRSRVSSFFLISRDSAALDRDAASIANAADSKGSTESVRFELRDIPSGSWDLLPVCWSSLSGAPYIGRIAVEVKDRDIADLIVSVRPNIELDGRILLRDPAGLPMKGLSVEMQVRDTIPAAIAFSTVVPPRGVVSPDGAFRIPSLHAAKYSVTVSGLPRGAYVAAMRLGPETSGNGIVRVDYGISPLELTIGFGATSVNGRVLGRNRLPLERAAVVLVPQSTRRENPTLYKRVSSGAAGEFSIPEVPPGEYKVFAWQTAPEGRAEESPHFMAEYEHLGRSLTVRLGVPVADLQVDVIADKP